jgi:predicted GH43/DUF377 family glycosyl hydrolase
MHAAKDVSVEGKERGREGQKKSGPVVSGILRAAKRRFLLAAIKRRAQQIPSGGAPPLPHQLERHEGNPVIEPREGNWWEMKATFNPAAVYADRRVHLLYRAIGGDDVSALGYASSRDGVMFDARGDRPAYVSRVTKETAPEETRVLPAEGAYLSGGGWNGGAEDPRLTMIDDRVYLTYTAFDGWGSVRIGLSSIARDDFLAQRWHWEKPSLISPPGEIHKNWVIFPEKINGKFAILHGLVPKVLIEYRDSLAFEEGETIRSERPANGTVRANPGVWDSYVRGVGPPPLKTEDGWLVFYHAIDARDPGRYKLGAMLLDRNDPTKILYRTQSPILEPDFDYENNGFKAGVVYACGAVVKDGELFVYYGGADSVTCVAMADLATFLAELKRHGTPKLEPEKNANARKTNVRR